jgi:catechol 2,3-dioxygenase-like lactoylglutathione lyase family enzyme
MLLDGVNHVAVLTNDTDRLQAFYREVFDATVARDAVVDDGVRLSFVHIGPHTELNVFQIDGNSEAEVCVENPDAEPGVFNPPGTPAARYVGS